MTAPLIDVTSAPHAHRTSWAFDKDEGNYVLVLENAAGQPIAFANYSYESWLTAFDNLMEAERSRIAHGVEADGGTTGRA
jgi:hypothetical protein